MAMNRLIIMRGVPGSGKSTEAKRIKAEAALQGLSVAIHSTDIYFMSGGVYAFDPERLPDSHAKNRNAARYSMIRGINVVIIDNTNTTEAEFEPYVSMATACGYSVGFREPSSPWWLDARKSLMGERCPLEIDRHATTMAAKCSHGVPAHVIANMLCRYQVI